MERARIRRAVHDGCRSQSSFSCFCVMRRRYKTSSPCVNGARLLRTAGELSGSAIQDPFGVFKALSKPSRRSPCRRSAWIFFPLTMLRSKDRIIRAAKITGIARIVRIIWIAKIAGLARIADERPAPVRIGRESRRNEEGLAGMQKVSPGCINRQLIRCACRARQPPGCVNRRAAGSKDRRKGRRGTARPL